jgi:hypothetical protein
MSGITTLFLKLSITIIIWFTYMWLMAEFILSRPVYEWIQVASVLIGLLLTVGCIKYTVITIEKKIKKVEND